MADDNNNTIINQEVLVIIIIDGSDLMFCRLKYVKQVVKVQMEEVKDVDNGSDDGFGCCWYIDGKRCMITPFFLSSCLVLYRMHILILKIKNNQYP